MKNKNFQSLISKIRSYNSKENFYLIRKAYHLANEIHRGQKRLSGDPFISHPLAVAHILADWKLDDVSIAAALLHDTIEDGKLKIEEIKKKFGGEVANLVNGVTKIGEFKFWKSEEEKFIENFRKMIVVMGRDLRVVLIKLADRYHNLETLYVLPKEKQIRIARETLEIYAPLAERLGIGGIKERLEDLSFPYVYPEEYQWVKKYSAPYYKRTSYYVEKFKKEILKNLAEEGIRAQVQSRVKHLYSLYKKLLRPEVNRDINKIYDIIAFRIIVDTVEQCYLALGIIHKFYKPFFSRKVRDYIACPKPNGYRSLHTNVFIMRNKIAEIQIRTREMHEQAENGIAAHWYYSEQKAKKNKGEVIEKGFYLPSDKMAWVKELVRWQKRIIDSKEFLKAIKLDTLAQRIFVFSPRGDVYDLPKGATPVDFAYAVHSRLGDQCERAKVNNKIVALNYKLRNGEIVEIIANKNRKGPSRDWLNFVVTTRARQNILKYFKRN